MGALAAGCIDFDQLLQGYDGGVARHDLAGADLQPSGDDASLVDLGPPTGDLAAFDLSSPMLQQVDENGGTAQDLYAVTGDSGMVVACGAGGTLIFKKETQPWLTGASGTSANLRAATALGGEFWVGGDGATVLSSSIPLASWTPAGGAPGDVVSAFQFSPLEVLFGGAFGVYRHNTQTGGWMIETNGDMQTVSALWADAGGNGYGAITNAISDAAIKRDPNGAWSQAKPKANNTTAVWSIGGEVYLAGDMGAIYHYYGGSWQDETLGNTGDLNGLWAAIPTDVWVVGDNSKIARSSGDGKWVDVPTNAIANFRAVWGSDAANVYVVGTGGAILHFLP
jgi:hypothetical protein